MTRTTTLLILSSVILTACGQFSYKRGAGAAELQQVQHTCQSAGSDQAAVNQCLEKNGWVVKNLDDFDPVATIMPTSDNRSAYDAPANAPAPETAQPSAVANGDTAAPPKKAADVMDVFVIGSWWKAGGNPDKLKMAMSACTAELGEAHQPVTNAQTGSQKVTRGMLLCLRKQGWYGLQSKN